MSASSMARSSCASSRPADRPSRCGSTTLVCSTRTRVSSPAMAIVGRKVAARALADVGETSTVLRPRNSSACTTTAWRAPRCSCPRARRGAGSRKISPRTISVGWGWCELSELLADDAHLLAVVLVCGEDAHLVTYDRPKPATRRRLAQRHAHRFRVAEFACPHDLEGRRGSVIETDVQRPSHAGTVAQNVLQVVTGGAGGARSDQRRRRTPRPRAGRT